MRSENFLRALWGLVVLTLLGGAWLHSVAISYRSHGVETIAQRPTEEDSDQVGGRSTPTVVERGATAASAEGRIKLTDALHKLSHDLRELDIQNREVSTGDARSDSSGQIITLTLTFSGRFSTAFELLDRLDRHQWITRIKRFEIQRDPRATRDALSVAAEFEVLVASEEVIDR